MSIALALRIRSAILRRFDGIFGIRTATRAQDQQSDLQDPPYIS